eukprot:2042163-Rhodomonas_salina.1
MSWPMASTALSYSLRISSVSECCEMKCDRYVRHKSTCGPRAKGHRSAISQPAERKSIERSAISQPEDEGTGQRRGGREARGGRL